jgi:hypothetical protein
MKLNDLFSNIYADNGIWFSNNKREISYPETGNANFLEIEKNSFWFPHRNNCIVEAVKLYSKNEVFFDIGGGNGFVAKGLETNNFKTVLVEPGLKGCMNAKERGLENIVCSTLEDAGIKTNSCRAIGLFDVVEHIDDDIGFLKSTYDVLDNNGVIYLTVPSYKFLWSYEDEHVGHFRRYTVSQMENKLKSIGFETVYATYIFSFLPIPIFLFRTLPYLLKLKNNSKSIKKHKKEHSAKKGILSGLLNKIGNWELNCIKQRKSISFGGSCFIVARKIITS